MNVIGTVSKENIWHFTCAFCSGTWSVAVMDEWTPKELYCTHCGQQQTNQEVRTETNLSKTIPAPSEEAIEPSVSDLESSITIVQKTKERLYSEDRMTHKVCEEGWWNPITKECQGEGNGHNVVDNEQGIVYNAYIMLDTKTNLEKNLDNINHTMELVRTIVPLLMVALQVIILVKLFAG